MPPHDTTVRIIAAALSLKRFTVKELCHYTGLRRAQTDPVLAELKKDGFVLRAGEADSGSGAARGAHRPSGTSVLSDDQAKIQVLADRVYRVRQAVGEREDPDSGEVAAIETALEHLDLVLDVSKSAAEFQPLTRTQLQKVEGELQALYRQLERATYRRALDVRRTENNDHPIVASWRRWESCTALLNAIIDRWQRPESISRFVTIISPRDTPVRTLEVVSDPRFIDSALFLWIFHQQPFRQCEIPIDCRIVFDEWSEIPARVAQEPHAIGFFNRRTEGSTSQIRYWTDLCVYQGYALLAHSDLRLGPRPATLVDSDRLLKEFVRRQSSLGRDPTIISIGEDTDARFGDMLTPSVNRRSFHWETEKDANEAFLKFLSRRDALFVGGVPQRLRAEALGHVPVLDSSVKPGLYSLNGLLFNVTLGQDGQALLQAAESMWLDTVSRMKCDPAFREEARHSINTMLDQSGATQRLVHFDAHMFERVFGHDDLLQFPETPAEMTRFYVDHTAKWLRSELAARPAQTETDIVSHFRTFAEPTRGISSWLEEEERPASTPFKMTARIS